MGAPESWTTSAYSGDMTIDTGDRDWESVTPTPYSSSAASNMTNSPSLGSASSSVNSARSPVSGAVDVGTPEKRPAPASGSIFSFLYFIYVYDLFLRFVSDAMSRKIFKKPAAAPNTKPTKRNQGLVPNQLSKR